MKRNRTSRRDKKRKTVKTNSKRKRLIKAIQPFNRVLPPLSEVIEQHIFSYLHCVPDRLNVERVCKRWRSLSLNRVQYFEMDLCSTATKSMNKAVVVQMLSRPNASLVHLFLPNLTLNDQIITCVTNQITLKSLRGYRFQRKHLLSILRSCRNLEILEILDCQGNTLSGINTLNQCAPLQTICLYGSNCLSNQSARAIIDTCSNHLKKLVLTGSVDVNSSIFYDIVNKSVELEELTFRRCGTIILAQLQMVLNALSASIRWLDLSNNMSIRTFPETRILQALQVIVLDDTNINDEGLLALSRNVPNLRYLSLQDCRKITDFGIQSIATSPHYSQTLEVIDLKGTYITDESINILEEHCKSLKMIRVESCRSISRNLRLAHSKKASHVIASGALRRYESLQLHQLKTVANNHTSESSEDSETSSSNED